MSPKRIIKKAGTRKLDMIGVCDHNSAENVLATFNAAKGKKVKVFAGMEVTSTEEVHILALFDKVEDVLALQGSVYANLPPDENKPEVFGEQIIANELDEVEGFNNRLLISATKLTVAQIIEKIHRLEGLAIASHVDRPSYSIIGQLGFIPDDLPLDGLEISANTNVATTTEKFPGIKKYPLVTSSDAHNLEEIGCAMTYFYLAEPSVPEIRKALRNEEGRALNIGKGKGYSNEARD